MNTKQFGDSVMNTKRISTTISQKHWELLNKYVEKYNTQQKALEVALENLENLENRSKKCLELTPEEKLWMHYKNEKIVCALEKNAFKLLIENANLEPLQEYFIQSKLIESRIELFFQRPIKELSLKELIIGLVSTGKLINWFETLDYTDNDSHHTLAITHSYGPHVSKLIVTVIRSMFKTYGVKTEITVSPMTIFIKIFKI